MLIDYISIFSFVFLLSSIHKCLLTSLLLMLGLAQLGNAGLADDTEKLGHLGGQLRHLNRLVCTNWR